MRKKKNGKFGLLFCGGKFIAVWVEILGKIMMEKKTNYFVEKRGVFCGCFGHGCGRRFGKIGF